jgi:protein TonB
MAPRRIVALVSVLVHAFAVVFIVVAQLLAVGPLPTPRNPLTFSDVRLVQIRDIDLPASSRPPAPSRATASPDSAPIVAPPAITNETGFENVHTPPPAAADAAAVEGGPAGLGFGIPGDRVAPPPPPPPPAPRDPVRLYRGMQMPRKVFNVDPGYPTLARSAHVEGVVILEAVIDATGKVESVRVLRSIPPLDQAAVDAVRQWRFTPTLLSGVPVPVVMTVTVNFTLK